MITDAIAAAEAGQKVLVVIGHEESRWHIEGLVRDGASDEARKNIRVETYKAVENGRVRGRRFGRWFEDHLAGEERAREWQRINLQPLLVEAPRGEQLKAEGGK